jgi:hypothetical protein
MPSDEFQMKNTFFEELKKYQAKALDTWLMVPHSKKAQCTTHLRKLITQVVALK